MTIKSFFESIKSSKPHVIVISSRFLREIPLKIALYNDNLNEILERLRFVK
ncbi:hypothetical protein MNBD_CHLOROFLEXI01-2963 [hydrothermal vent metagenome]|uniref:Uncharacterized protein n=1 Tax=hydrothermal vent metagenome TaxID=652676 RepID=A0A3B0V0C3_9ZZZZ